MWTKIGAGFFTQPAMLRLPRGARLMHLEVTDWSNQHSTDGVVPAAGLGRITDEPDPFAAAELLVDVGLWQGDADDGWTLMDFLRDQPSAEDVARTAELNRARQRRQRQHRNGDHSLCDPRYCHVTRDATSDKPVSHNTRTATDRTDPTRAGTARGSGGKGGSGSPSAGAPGGRVPLLPIRREAS